MRKLLAAFITKMPSSANSASVKNSPLSMSRDAM